MGYRKICVGLGRQLPETESILAKEDDYDMPIESSIPCDQEPPAENYPEAVLFSGLGMLKCHGCKGEIVLKSTCHLQILH